MLIILISLVAACEHHHGEDIYNLTELMRPEPYLVRISADSSFFKMAYSINDYEKAFNFCGNHPKQCQNQPAAYETIEVLGMLTDSCEQLGKPDNYTAVPIENGLQVTYLQGSPCTDGRQRSAIFNIQCSENSDANFQFISSDKCAQQFSIKSPAGCKYKQTHDYLLPLIIGGILIVALGVVFSVKKIKPEPKPENYEQLVPEKEAIQIQEPEPKVD